LSLRASQHAPNMSASALYEPTLLAAATRAPIFLRRGLWPVNILGSPAVVRFCEWLPASWRADRRLHRQRVVRTGLSPAWTRPPLRENFRHVLAAGLRCLGRDNLTELMRDSLLADIGLVDPAAVLAAGQRVDAGAQPPAGLYEALNLELALRALRT